MAHLPKGQGVVPMPPFLGWLASNIPAVYDNTMSYYEELTSLIKYLQDTVIPALNADSEAITVISNAMEQLQSYVDHYFDSLDVQQEINNKIDVMVADGTFQTILDQYIQPQLDRLDTKIDNTQQTLEGEIGTLESTFRTEISNETNARNNADNVLQNQINGLASGSPLVASSVGEMTDTSKVYVNTSDGYWYYYDGDSWEQGGVYQSSGVVTDTTLTQSGVPADAKATGDTIFPVKDATTISTTGTISEIIDAPRTAGSVYKDGTVNSSTTLEYFTIDVQEGDTFAVTDTTSYIRFVCAYVGDTVDSSLGTNTAGLTYTVPATVTKLTITTYNNVPIFGTLVNRTTVSNKIDPDNIVHINGSSEVSTKNIKGMINTNETIMSDNLMNTEVETVATGKYIIRFNSVSGQIEYGNNANINTYRIRVSSDYYTFTMARYVALVKKDGETGIGSVLSNQTEVTVNDSDAYYIYFCITTSYYDPATFVVRNRINKYLIPNNWVLNSNVVKSRTQSVNDSLANGEYIEIESPNALKNEYAVTAKAFITSLGKLRLAFISPSGSATNYIDVNSTTLTVKNTTGDPTVYNHGLTIANDLSIRFVVKDGKATITVTSKGVSYKTVVQWVQNDSTVSYPRLVSENTVAPKAILSVDMGACKHDVWMFGDSYMGYQNNARWAYYMVQDGLSDNILGTGSAGCTSEASNTTLEALLDYATPKIAVLATGMNDGTDSDDTPSANWVTRKNNFLSICSANGITPILATIPTVPSVNNEAKNTWVRTSGYRYIDFAKAVGANSSGVWYTGMLSTDNVHPTELGAKALYDQVLVDLPEIFG